MSQERIRPQPTEGKELISYNKTALVFPGQGSQEVGMGLEMYTASPAAKRVFERANDALGFDLSKIIFKGPEKVLRGTINSQPAILTVSIAALEVLKEVTADKMPTPSFVAGHSLGQYTASVAAGVIAFEDAVKLVRERGRLMQLASRRSEGGMAAILRLDLATIEEICRETGVEIANINSDDQIVISGDKLSVATAMDFALQRGARRAIPLTVSGAFHSSLMAPAQPGLEKAISGIDFKDPDTPIVANSTSEHLTTAGAVKQELVNGLCMPVQWKASVQKMKQTGVRTVIELGPGSTLSSLVRRIDKTLNTFNIASPDSAKQLVSQLA